MLVCGIFILLLPFRFKETKCQCANNYPILAHFTDSSVSTDNSMDGFLGDHFWVLKLCSGNEIIKV